VVAVLHRSAFDFLLSGVLATALVGVLATLVERGRVTLRPWRTAPWRSVGTGAGFLAMQVAAGAVAAALLVALEWLVAMTVRDFAYEVTYLALHPWTLGRLATIVGLLAWQAAACWAIVLVFVSMLLSWRVRHAGVASWLVILACWIGPSLFLWRLLERRGWAAPQEPMLLVLVVAGATSWILIRGLGWYRRGSQALRLTAALLAVVIPSLLLYPSLSYFATRRTEHLIERAYAPEAMAHPRALKARLDEAQVQVDRQPGLAARIKALEASATRQTDAAFFIWQQTVLARERLTSAVELYDTTGRLVSRFALNFPEYAARTPQYHASRCDWETFGEAAPFGAEERRMLHAEKAVCEPDGRVAGSVVVHVMPDYDVLSFISAGSPYFELFRGERRGDSHPGGEVALVIYGWGRTVIYSSTARAWPLDEPLFRRIYQSRTPFWATLSGADANHRVFFSNDRFGIYALDYALPGLFDHFVHLAEVATLAALVFVVLVVGTGLVRRLAGADVQPGRRLLREIRTSFYRKLFLAFVGASVVPALVLALLIRSFVAARLRADVEDEAARTVAVAQRVVEETVALPPFSESGLAALNDDLMVWVSRVLNQSVNVFDGPHLVATSERDLFASGLLPTRVPDAIFRAIVLDRLPTYVGEDEMADVRYLLAAAPVRAAGPNAILTVPLALRQREIEREIDDLDRGVQLGALLFVLLGAGIGFWMAERIGDPVQRLTRASKRIAAGDLDARVYVRSADELQRLVESFNGMAVELQRQRSQLERTNRLEAWAEMARQVAHDIKNPLTPIQLSAEHLRRVHADMGEPLGPVLDACTTTILTQVRLLRQIAGEFSSFATTPAPRPVPTDVRDLLGEVLQAYVTGLAGRVVTRLDVAADVPHVVVDRMLIGRAVTNVIENALHAMPNGGRLEVQAVREGDMLAITVRDTGVGMDDEALARLFEPYFSTKAIGTGLGLTIARRNVELHGGSIAVDSRRGEGTTVTLRVPIAQATASD
jgi:signal transduction histidine kinase